MKNALVLASLMTVLASTSAKADGFICETPDGTLSVKVFNQTEPKLGTRNAAILILADLTVAEDRQTIATFPSDNDLLENSSATYIANVDLRYTESGRGGENILGTKLGKIDDIVLDVNFDYTRPLRKYEETDAKLILIKRNGEKIRSELVCSRYLKN